MGMGNFLFASINIYGEGYIQDASHIDIYICKNVFSILVDNSYEMMGRFLQN